MKCEKCQKQFLGALCWECNDIEIVEKYRPQWSDSHEKSKKALEEGVTLIKELQKTPKMTLPLDSQERKGYPLFRGCFKYFSAALAGVSKISQKGNDKHNPGEEMHHARNKSSDHGDCILRHLMDTEDLLAAYNRGESVSKEQILEEISQMAWRSLALSQELHERLGGAPLAPGAKR